MEIEHAKNGNMESLTVSDAEKYSQLVEQLSDIFYFIGHTVDMN